MLGHPLASRNRRHIVGALFLHQFHDLRGHVGTVLYRVNPGFHRALHAFRTVGMHRHNKVVVVSRLHDGLEFIRHELRVITAPGQAPDTAGDCQLNHIGTIFVTLSNRWRAS